MEPPKDYEEFRRLFCIPESMSAQTVQGLLDKSEGPFDFYESFLIIRDKPE